MTRTFDAIRPPRGPRNKLLVLLAAILIPALLGLVGLELVHEFRNSRTFRAEVDRSYEARFQIERVPSLLQEAETGVHAYIVSGDDRDLVPYQKAAATLDDQEDRIKALLSVKSDGPSPRSLDDSVRLKTLADRKMAILAEAVEARRSGAAPNIILAGYHVQHREIADDAQRVVARMIAMEANSLNQRSAAADHRTVRSGWLVGALFTAFLAGLIATAFQTRRYLSHRRTILADLKATTSRQRAISDSAIDSIVTLNPEGKIETVNAAGERMFGYSAAELCGHDASRVLIDIAPAGEGEFLQRLGASQGGLTTGLIRQMEGARRSGETFPVDVALGAMPLASGNHVVAVVRDISERRRIEQLKDEFVATVSHELRTPLTSIAGSLGLLVGGAAGPLPDKAARLIQIAQANSQRLVRLTNDILDIEKIESGKLRLQLAPLDLLEIAERSVEGLQGYARELGVHFAFGDSEAAPVRGDEDRLIQVVTNLLSNASKFSPAGGVVTVTVTRENRLARLTVVDQGPGISDVFRTQIFSKFAQADGSDTRAKGGTGLGLAIAREIAERHGGRLWFESAEGEGASFHLDLPLADAPAASGEDRGARLMIVEDDTDAADILREMLEHDGFAADIAGTARDALVAIRDGSYDACLVDLRLSDADAIGLIRQIRANYRTRNMPVIVVSADAVQGKARGRSFEVIDWLEKPVDQARLRSAVSAINRRNGEARALILHVDHDQDTLDVTTRALSDIARIVQARTLTEASLMLATGTPDLVILSLGMPDGTGLEVLSTLGAETARVAPVVLYSAQQMDEALAGHVDDVLTKSRTSLAGLTRSLRRLTHVTNDRTKGTAE